MLFHDFYVISRSILSFFKLSTGRKAVFWGWESLDYFYHNASFL